MLLLVSKSALEEASHSAVTGQIFYPGPFIERNGFKKSVKVSNKRQLVDIERQRA